MNRTIARRHISPYLWTPLLVVLALAAVPPSVRAASSDASLSNLELSAGTINPAFNSATYDYNLTVPYTSNSITVTPTTTDPNATVTVDTVPVASGSASGPITLPFGLTTISVAVIAEDTVAAQTYTVTVYRPYSTHPLKDLNPAAAFGVGGVSNSSRGWRFQANDNVDVYELGCNNPMSQGQAYSIMLWDFSTQEKLVQADFVRTNPGAWEWQTLATPVPLVQGHQYIVSMFEVESSYYFGMAGAEWYPSGTIQYLDMRYANGATTNTFPPNTLQGYQYGIPDFGFRPSVSLSDLTLSNGTLTPAFSAFQRTYDATVANGVESITVTPTVSEPLWTLTVEGDAVASGSASDPIPLSVGPNTITIVVTNENSTSATYTLTVTRLPSSNATLSNLALSAGTLSPAFATNTHEYSTSLVGVSTLTVTPTVADNTATVKVNDTAVASGTASGPISLNFGPNKIAVVGTAQDTETQVFYTVTVNRLPTLASFTASPLLVNLPTNFTLGSDAPSAVYSWNFGDSTPVVTGVNPSHTYLVPGPYTVTVTVTDPGTGTSNSGEYPITISAGADDIVYLYGLLRFGPMGDSASLDALVKLKPEQILPTSELKVGINGLHRTITFAGGKNVQSGDSRSHFRFAKFSRGGESLAHIYLKITGSLLEELAAGAPLDGKGLPKTALVTIQLNSGAYSDIYTTTIKQGRADSVRFDQRTRRKHNP